MLFPFTLPLTQKKYPSSPAVRNPQLCLLLLADTGCSTKDAGYFCSIILLILGSFFDGRCCRGFSRGRALLWLTARYCHDPQNNCQYRQNHNTFLYTVLHFVLLNSFLYSLYHCLTILLIIAFFRRLAIPFCHFSQNVEIPSARPACPVRCAVCYLAGVALTHGQVC